jgi:hypothetical protein
MGHTVHAAPVARLRPGRASASTLRETRTCPGVVVPSRAYGKGAPGKTSKMPRFCRKRSGARPGMRFKPCGDSRERMMRRTQVGDPQETPKSLLKNRARQRIRTPWWLDERLRRGFSGGIPCGRRALFQKASLRRSRRSRPSPLLRLALWKNASPRYQPGFFNRLLKREICLPHNQWMGNPPLRRAGAGNSAVWCPPRPAERSRGGGRHRRHHAMPMDKEKVCPSVRAMDKKNVCPSAGSSICGIVQHRRTHRQKVCPSICAKGLSIYRCLICW